MTLRFASKVRIYFGNSEIQKVSVTVAADSLTSAIFPFAVSVVAGLLYEQYRFSITAVTLQSFYSCVVSSVCWWEIIGGARFVCQAKHTCYTHAVR